MGHFFTVPRIVMQLVFMLFTWFNSKLVVTLVSMKNWVVGSMLAVLMLFSFNASATTLYYLTGVIWVQMPGLRTVEQPIPINTTYFNEEDCKAAKTSWVKMRVEWWNLYKNNPPTRDLTNSTANEVIKYVMLDCLPANP